MKVVTNKLNLGRAFDETVVRQLDRFPPLTADLSLLSNKAVLLKTVAARFAGGSTAVSVEVSVPRRAYGTRPVIVPDLATRLVYAALVIELEDCIPAPSRAPGRWHVFTDLDQLPLEENDYLLEFDIASCYEHIDHAKLREELLIRSMNLAVTSSIMDFLGEATEDTRGLPQMLTPSDRLADAFLEGLERDLLRSGFSRVARFVDDFKVAAATYEEALRAADLAAETARRHGLILAVNKTRIVKAATERASLKTRNDAIESFLFPAGRDDFNFWWGGYDGDEEADEDTEEETTPSMEDLRALVKAWYDADVARDEAESDSQVLAIMQSILPLALSMLAQDDQRLPRKILQQMVFRDPMRLETVCRYLNARAETEKNYAVLSQLITLPRQTSWSELWLLHTIGHQTIQTTPLPSNLTSWVLARLDSRNELVRSEAAWVAAKIGALTEQRLSDLYQDASSITRPALAACCGVAQFGADSGSYKAMQKDTMLFKSAYAWGAGHVSTKP